ncbi:50S ribosomal protein L33-like [Mytilus californianus]|uniref:50S ribosomal protein L33-like n=1 Tax=Mytilus californianus TaxID=6549 RepID=UPI0022450A40|nr:50S ribosomal protein L33-like [Mytilus californianus]
MSTTPLRIVLGKTVLVRMESLAGTGHKINRLRPKQFTGGKFEVLSHDPFVQQTVLYREIKKLKTIRKLPGMHTKK